MKSYILILLVSFTALVAAAEEEETIENTLLEGLIEILDVEEKGLDDASFSASEIAEVPELAGLKGKSNSRKSPSSSRGRGQPDGKNDQAYGDSSEEDPDELSHRISGSKGLSRRFNRRKSFGSRRPQSGSAKSGPLRDSDYHYDDEPYYDDDDYEDKIMVSNRDACGRDGIAYVHLPTNGYKLLVSPNFPDKHGGYQDCKYIFYTSRRSRGITAHIHVLDLERDYRGCEDWLLFDKREKKCGKITGYDYKTKKRYMVIEFHSDARVAEDGYVISVERT